RLVFFFQAEDGIRDGHVTGVQTSALPILAGRQTLACGGVGACIAGDVDVAILRGVPGPIRSGERGEAGEIFVDLVEPAILVLARSEERRVGKECRSRWVAYQ